MIEEVEDGGALFFPEVLEEIGDDGGHADEGGEDDIDIAVAIDVIGIHGEPAAGDAFAEGGGLEFEGAFVFEVNEAFAG